MNRSKNEQLIITAGFHHSLSSEKIWKPNEIKEVLKEVRKHFRFAYSNKKVKYFNVPCAFDIETSSFYEDGEKRGIMYEWTFGIFGAVVIGRTWDEFVDMMEELRAALNLNVNKRLMIFCHNFSFEFQWIRKLFVWEKVFALSNRKPCYAVTNTGYEFRCSYILSGYSLVTVGKNLQSFNIKKLVGDLDYRLIRHSKTYLSPQELAYCVNDVKIVMAYIWECMERDGNIAKLQITKTGYARKFCRDSCFYEPDKPRKKSYKRLRYKEYINGLTLEPEEYEQLKRAFQGGFTHANPFYSGKVVKNVTSYDFTSSYPTVLIAEQFPISTGELVEIGSIEELERNLKLYCCLFDVEFFDLESKLYFESYISRSRCWDVRNATVNNGRIVRADHLHTTITEQDYMIIKKFYKWGRCRISNFRRYKKGYLPTDFVKCVIDLYKAKTELKDIAGMESEYMGKKEILNSCYGMICTDIVRPEYCYSDEWDEPIAPDLNTEIEKYNKNAGRFLFYPWGVWVCAYARRNLFTGILEFGNDYVYADTDSIKTVNTDRHVEYIERYNDQITKQLQTACGFHGFDISEIAPKNKKGVAKPLGIWDFDGHYKRFKTLGAKRYLVEYSDDIRNGDECGVVKITVSGLNKKKTVPYLCKGWAVDIKTKHEVNNPFNKFKKDLFVPQEFTGKLTHTYIDEEHEGTITDYNGIIADYHEYSAVHLEPASYDLSIAGEYVDYLLGLEYFE